MKKIGDITNKKIDVEKINSLFNKVLRDKDISKFIKKNNLSENQVQENMQLFFSFYFSKKKSKEIEYNPKLIFKDNKMFLELAETSSQRKKRESKKYENIIKTKYISKKLLYSNFSSISNDSEKIILATRLIEICDKKLNKSNVKGTYIYGKTGIGKSYLMGCVYNYLTNKGIEPAIIYFPEFVRKIKSLVSNGDYNYIIDLIREQEVLIIDDLGAENITEFVRDEILVPIINYRSSENLLTFFTSNLGIKDLSDFLSVTKNSIDETKSMRIVDRIRFLSEPVYLDSKNQREF